MNADSEMVLQEMTIAEAQRTKNANSEMVLQEMTIVEAQRINAAIKAELMKFHRMILEVVAQGKDPQKVFPELLEIFPRDSSWWR